MKIRKPDFLIVGSAKCGTTALDSILAEHPSCCMGRPKEASFFQDTTDFDTNPNFAKDWEWYQQYFSHYNADQTVGEATPSYSDRTRSPNTAKRVYEFNSEMKIIYMTRDPLQRQISCWKMQYASGADNSLPGRREHKWALRGFDYWMKQQRDVDQWSECRYKYQLDAYREYFDDARIFVSFLEDWSINREQVIIDCCKFLCLDEKLLSDPDVSKWNRAEDRRIERPMLKKIRSSPAIRQLVRMLPEGIRDYARDNYTKKKMPEFHPNLMSPIVREFSEYVRGDCLEFLSTYGKEIATWPFLANE